MQQVADLCDRRLELAIVNPGAVGLMGSLRARALERRAALCTTLAETDAALVAMAARREEIVDQIARVDRALRGDPAVAHRRTGATHRAFRPRKTLPPDECPPVPPVEASDAEGCAEGRPDLAADDLRAIVLDLLAASPGPVRVCELVDVARAIGGRPRVPSERRTMSQAVSNLLRPEVAAGRVERVGRGRYRWVG